MKDLLKEIYKLREQLDERKLVLAMALSELIVNDHPLAAQHKLVYVKNDITVVYHIDANVLQCGDNTLDIDYQYADENIARMLENQFDWDSFNQATNLS